MATQNEITHLTDVIIKQATQIGQLNKLLSTIYLNHINDDSVHGGSLKREIEALAEYYGGDLLFQINLYKG